jgi:hypothetical protein
MEVQPGDARGRWKVSCNVRRQLCTEKTAADNLFEMHRAIDIIVIGVDSFLRRL